MLDKTQEEKVKRFVSDKMMSDAVYKIVEDVITRASKDRDVNILAAKFLSIELIREAWRELGKYATKEAEVERKSQQVGL